MRPFTALRLIALFAVAPAETAAGDERGALAIDDLLSVERLVAAEVVAVSSDPVYFRAKRYLAFPVRDDVAELAGRVDAGPGAEVVFDCTDGYRSRMPLEAFLSERAWLAFRDLDAPSGGQWGTYGAGPPAAKMGRCYIVWPDAERPEALTWPYAVERIRVVPKGGD